MQFHQAINIKRLAPIFRYLHQSQNKKNPSPTSKDWGRMRRKIWGLSADLLQSLRKRRHVPINTGCERYNACTVLKASHTRLDSTILLQPMR